MLIIPCPSHGFSWAPDAILSPHTLRFRHFSFLACLSACAWLAPISMSHANMAQIELPATMRVVPTKTTQQATDGCDPALQEQIISNAAGQCPAIESIVIIDMSADDGRDQYISWSQETGEAIEHETLAASSQQDAPPQPGETADLLIISYSIAD